MGKSNVENEKRSIIIFTIVVIVSGIAGFIVGGLANIVKFMNEANSMNIVDAIYKSALSSAPYIMIIANVLAFIISFLVYLYAKKMVPKVDDEEVYEKIESMLNIPLFITSVMMAVDYFLFGATFVGFNQNIISSDFELVTVGVFIACLVWITAVQNMTVKLEKVLNPEKRGTVFDLDFAKKWEESCDEAEKYAIYKSGYTAYKVGTGACMALWLILIVTSLSLGTGLMPILCVSTIWLSMIIAYHVMAAKLS
ncbi:MAG: DUF3169 family protein [Lachnospiraceae bacterium]|nr:DUF3169 family protein [Lachnospiraceae bacterium]